MTTDIGSTLKDYGAAWCEPDEDKRRALLEKAWTGNGTYQDPSSQATNREELISLIGGMHKKFPGSGVVITSGASEHHGRIYFEWQMVTGDGNIAIKGVDFGTIAEDGRLEEIVGFFGPPPAL